MCKISLRLALIFPITYYYELLYHVNRHICFFIENIHLLGMYAGYVNNDQLNTLR